MGLQKFRHDLATKATSQNTISCKVIINIINRTVSFLKILNVLKKKVQAICTGDTLHYFSSFNELSIYRTVRLIEK